MIVDCAVYEDGQRRAGELPLDEAYDACRREDGAWVWIGLHEPSEQEFDSVRREFNLHELAVEDAIKAHQRPKLEVYDDTLFLVLKTARYHDREEAVEVGEILLFVGAEFIVSVRHGSPSDLHPVREQLEAKPELLRCGPTAVLYAILDRVVDDYEPVIVGINQDIEEVEEEVFAPGRVNPAERIYKLKREVLQLHKATFPLVDPLRRLSQGEFGLVHGELTEYMRDVYDHVMRANDGVEAFSDLLNGILGANLAQVSVRQNEDMRRISAWVAIIATPTLIAGIYGMNFEHMPELGWTLGYPGALALMLVLCTGLYRYFRKVGWL